MKRLSDRHFWCGGYDKAFSGTESHGFWWARLYFVLDTGQHRPWCRLNQTWIEESPRASGHLKLLPPPILRQSLRRLLALAAIYDGGTRNEAARIGGVTLQIVRDWVMRFNAHGPDGLIDHKSTGRPARLNDAHRAAVAAMIESGPTPALHGVVRWRLVDLCQWLWDEHQVTVAKQTLGRELRAMNYRKLSARPRHHTQAEGAIELFKTVSPAV